VATIPYVRPDADGLTAALAYVGAGLDIGPLRQGSKNPGSVLGSWPTKTFGDAEHAVAWFAGTDYGIFLHCGRCGLAVLDVDHPDAVPAAWWPVLATAPFQRSRPEHPRRGHYVFAAPPGRRIGNSAHPWGEVRGENGVIVLAPTKHADADAGARYEWVRTGSVPLLEEIISSSLPDGGDRRSTISDDAVRAWRERFRTGRALHLVRLPLGRYINSVTTGGSRHEAAVRAAATMTRDIAAGLYPSWYLDSLESAFRTGFTPQELARGRGSDTEWLGIVAWAVAQVTDAEVAEVRLRVLDARMTPRTPSPHDSDPSGAWDAWS
jgi:hypothetical protein